MFWVNYMYFNQNYQDVFVFICGVLKFVFVNNNWIVFEYANVFF